VIQDPIFVNVIVYIHILVEVNVYIAAVNALGLISVTAPA